MDLAVLDVATLKSRHLGSPQTLYGSPQWSHSGKQIACEANLLDRPYKAVLALVSYPALTARYIPLQDPDLTASVGNGVAWSPDDQQVALSGSITRDLGEETERVWPLWVVDVGSGSSRRVWEGEPKIQVLDVGYEADSGLPCFVTQKTPRQSPGHPLMLYRVDSHGKLSTSASLVPREGWLLRYPKLFPDGKGLVAVTANRLDPTPGGEMKAELVWSHAGHTGHIALPAGYTGHILGWSGDGRRLGVSCYNGTDAKIAVYQFN